MSTAEITIATWNVNSIKARLAHLVKWLDSFKPDVVALQELKTTDEGFPGLEIQAAGYHWAMAGQKSYIGVALLSKEPIELLEEALPGDEKDEQARYIEGRTLGLRVGAIYLPNG
ncbi:MAG: endonuclease/exonuclease/phosphatase family protein, partial [Firmicutes bacterium]|nr:endonuclease/exonuclease/phosphatase family protein [Bacillota bacterium]